MFWRKVFHILVISVLLMGGFSATSVARESKTLVRTSLAKPLAPAIIYVDGDAPGPIHDGISWTNAYTTVQDALAVASSGNQIWVAEGIYYPDEGTGQTNDVITSTFTLTDSVKLYGGFAGIEGSLEERDWKNHITVLSGDIDNETNPDATDANGVVTDTANIIGNNAYHVVYSGSAVIDGFIITAGLAFGSEYPADDDKGGGMYHNDGNLILRNLTFSGNLAYFGGGMFNYSGSDPILTDVTFLGNAANSGGGGMYNDDGSSPLLTNVYFSKNVSMNPGGGMANNSSSPTLINVTFSDNTAEWDGGGISSFDSSHPILNNVTFINNSANDGGGMSNTGHTHTILTNAVFLENSAEWAGGGIYNGNNSNPTLTNVSFFSNSARNGGGMYNFNNSNPTLGNAIYWDNTATVGDSQIDNNTSNPSISYSLIQGCGGSGSGWDSSLGTDGGGNIDADPLFVDPVNNDLHLGAGSPAIDAGDDSNCPITDFDGIPRPQGAGCDMGAYEYATFDLQMTVDNPSPKPGEIITFTIKVTNYLTTTTSSGLISDTIPSGLNFLEIIALDPPMSGTIDLAPPTLVTDLEIGVGRRVTVTLPVSVSDGLAAGTIITNTAWITSTEVITPVLGSISITIANAPPVANDDLGIGFITDRDTAFTTLSVLDNDTDPNEDTLTLDSFDTTGTLGLVISNGDGTFDYDPNGQFEYLGPGEQATDSFTYTISDGHGGIDTAAVTITITGVQDGFYIYLPIVMRP